MVTAGEVLKRKRESLGRSLDTVSLETKIQKRFLKYIENNEFHRFESEVFLTGFIKIYSEYLQLDTSKVLALYRRSNPKGLPKQKKTEEKKKEKGKKTKIDISQHMTVRNITTAIVTLFIISILAYIGIQIYKFQSPPQLNISEPANESIVTQEKITIKGDTHPEAMLEINEKLITIEEGGEFQTEIKLNPGINTITVKARKNSNNILETVETLKITYNQPEESQELQAPEITTNTVRLEIFDSSAWVKLDIDNVNQVSQIVQPSKQEYEINEKLALTTGRASNTRIYFNNELIQWPNPTATGVVEISCTVNDKQISCE